MNRPQYELPQELTSLLLEFTVNVMTEQPGDLVEFAARYFSALRDERQRSSSAVRPPAIAETDEVIHGDEDVSRPPKSMTGTKSVEVQPPSSRSVPLVRSTDSQSPQIL